MPENRRDPSRRIRRTFRPVLETMEDRSLPGNTILGATGFVDPLALLGAASKKVSGASTSPAASTVAKKLASQPWVSSLARSVSTASKVSAGTSSKVQFPTSYTVSSANLTGISGGGAAAAAAPLTTTDILQGMLSAEPVGIKLPGTQPAVSAAQPTAFLTSTGSTAGALDQAGNPGNGMDRTTNVPSKADANEGTVDYRAQTTRAMSAEQVAALNALKLQFPALLTNVDSTFGAPRSLLNGAGYLTGPQPGAPTTVGINYLRQNATLLGVSQADINALVVNSAYSDPKLPTSNVRLNYLQLQQQVSGIPVWSATTMSLTNDGKVLLVGNGMVPNLAGSVNTVTPTISAVDAITAAASNLGLQVTSPITPVTPESGATRKGTYSDGGFARQAVQTELMLVPVGYGNTRLAWHVTMINKNDYGFEFFVDAVTNQVLVRNSLVKFDSYTVLQAGNGDSPDQAPIKAVVNPADSLASPFGWHDINGKAGADYFITRGNNARASTRRDSTQVGNGLFPSGGPTNTYNYGANFKSDPSTYQAASAVDLFYTINTVHDAAYRAGFTENAGNYQQNQYGRSTPSRGNDAILGFAQDDADNGTADNAFWVSTGPDGNAGEVHMFVFDFSNPMRDGSFSMDIMTHELGHGLNARLAGGGFGLVGVQGNGLDEGLADFNGYYFSTGASQDFQKANPSGTWVLNQPANGLGVRRFPYSSNKAINPLTFNDIDPNQVDVTFPPNPPINPGLNPVDESHNMGEVIANTMYEMMGNLIQKYGRDANLVSGTGGNNRAYQLYITGLKQTPFAATHLDVRNGIIAADIALYGGADLSEIWSAFADRGMGQFADDGGSAASTNVTEDFTIPDSIPPSEPPTGGNGSNDSLYEPNETSKQAFDLGIVTGSNTVDGLAIQQRPKGVVQDRDWFKFTPTKTGVLTITTDVPSAGGDLDMRLYKSKNGSPTILTEVGKGQGVHRQPGQSETIKVGVTAGQTYYVNIIGFKLSTGNYNLIIDAPA